MKRTVLITGITGFFGSNLASFFLKNNYKVIGLHRRTSDMRRCRAFHNEVTWIELREGWQDKIVQIAPEIIIHTAWEGVQAAYRDELSLQKKNLQLLSELLAIAKEIDLYQFVALGSQAEYGVLTQIAYEDQPALPTTAYGIAKKAASDLVEQFCGSNNINWYWLRVFSVFGEGESQEWLIPSVFFKLYHNESEIAFSECSQKYAYLYVQDFSGIVFSIVDKPAPPKPGIYNVSGQHPIPLRDIIEKIKNHCSHSNTKLNFGALPFRPGQSMHVQGSMAKYFSNVGAVAFTDFDDALQNTLRFYISETN